MIIKTLYQADSSISFLAARPDKGNNCRLDKATAEVPQGASSCSLCTSECLLCSATYAHRCSYPPWKIEKVYKLIEFSLSFWAIKHIRIEPISDFVTFGWQVALTTTRTGHQSVAGNFPCKTDTNWNMGTVRKWRWIIFPKDKICSTGAGNRTLEIKNIHMQ